MVVFMVNFGWLPRWPERGLSDFSPSQHRWCQQSSKCACWPFWWLQTACQISKLSPPAAALLVKVQQRPAQQNSCFGYMVAVTSC